MLALLDLQVEDVLRSSEARLVKFKPASPDDVMGCPERLVAYRGLLSAVPGAWLPVTGGIQAHLETPEDVAGHLNLTTSWHVFAAWDLWIGVAVGIAFIAGAVWMRRWRELAD